MENESGRSLTEMMGTLAIMGILAIAGTWMYNTAMDKLKANTLVNEAQKRAVVVAGQIGFQGRTNPTLGEFTDNTFAGGTFSTNVITEGLYQQFGIQVSGVPKRVCQNILNSIGEGSPIRRLTAMGTPTAPMANCAETNTFLMIYNNDMSSSGNDPEYVSGACGCQTVCGVCAIQNGQEVCSGECPTNSNQCTKNSDCAGECVGCVIPSGQSTGTCQACQRVEYLESTATQWIDTGIDASGNLTVEAQAIFPNNDASKLFGYRINMTTKRLSLLASSDGHYYLDYGNGSQISSGVSINSNKQTFKFDKNVASIDGITTNTYK